MDPLIAAILGSIGGTATFVVAIRFAWPLMSRFVGTVLQVRKDLATDQDRIITNLRDEIGDLRRRFDGCKTELDEAISKANESEARVDELESFIDRFLLSQGTTREDIDREYPAASLEAARRARRKKV